MEKIFNNKFVVANVYTRINTNINSLKNVFCISRKRYYNLFDLLHVLVDCFILELHNKRMNV